MKADSLLVDVWDDPALEELQTEIRQAARQGEKGKVKTLRAQVSSTAAELMRARLSSLASSNSVNPRVIEAFRTGAAVLTTEHGRTNNWREGAFEEMGSLTRTDLGEVASDSRFSCRSGGASRKGARLEIAMATLNEVSDGASAIAAWLCQRGASDLKYDITSEEIWSEPGR
jgi:hypothetical protein